jgi:hypothetical protein
LALSNYKNIAQSQKAGFFVVKEFLTAIKNGFHAGERAFGFYNGLGHKEQENIHPIF